MSLTADASFIDTREAQEIRGVSFASRREGGTNLSPVRGRPTRAGAAEFEGVRRLRIKEPQLHESQDLKFKGDCDDGRSHMFR